jgi:hypothetical protein
LATHNFNIDPDFEFGIVGLTCQERDYRLAWALNLAFQWSLVREQEHEVPMKRGSSSHTRFEYKDEDNITYTLLANKGTGGYLLPEVSGMDFILRIEGYCHMIDDDMLRKIRKIPFVLAALELNSDKIKTIQNLISA